jgi:hypothetical protein
MYVGKCIFSDSSTNDKGGFEPPKMCKQAMLDKFKKIMETCEVQHEHECPIKRFMEAKKNGRTV